MEYIYLRLNGSRIEGVQTFERGEGEGGGRRPLHLWLCPSQGISWQGN